MQFSEAYPPSGPWVAGRLLRASAWSGVTLSGPDCILRTLVTPGDVAPCGAAPAWSLHLGLPGDLGAPDTVFLANGFVLQFPRRTAACRVSCIMIQRGVLLIDAGLPLPAALFSPTAGIAGDDQRSHVLLDGGAVALLRLPSSSGCRFALAATPHGTPETAFDLAQRAGEVDLPALLEREFALRNPFYEHLSGRDADLLMVREAVETLVFHLEQGAEGQSERWSAADPRGRRRVHSSHLLPLVLAWLRLDPVVALELLRGALRLPARHGHAPLEWDPLAPAAEPGPQIAWPCLIQALRAVFESQHDPAPVRELLPAAVQHLQAAIHRLDPDRAGRPRWPTRAESFLPPLFADHAAHCDAAALLLREIDDLVALQGAAGAEENFYTLDLEAYRQRLAAQIEESMWNPEEELYCDLAPPGAATAAPHLGGLLGMWHERAPPGRAQRVAQAALAFNRLGVEQGVALRRPPQVQDTPSPAPAAAQLFVSYALQRAEQDDLRADLEERVVHALSRAYQEHGVLPPDLREPLPPTAASGIWYEDPPMPAAVAVRSAPEVCQRSASTAPPWLLALERHHVAVISAGIALVGLAVLGVSLLADLPRQPDIAGLASPAGEDDPAPTGGRLEQAVAEIQDQIQSGRLSPAEGALAEAVIRFNQQSYPAAEQRFRDALDDPNLGPKALLNLALSVFRQSRYHDAAILYAKYLEQYPSHNAEWSYMAETALSFLRENGAAPASRSAEFPRSLEGE